MANMVRICPDCGAWRTDGVETCSMCGADNVKVDYSEIYWGKIEDAKRAEIIRNVVGSNFTVAKLDQNVSGLPKLRVGGIALFDDGNETFFITDRIRAMYRREEFEEFRYDDVVSFEVIEDGGMVMSGGVGRAVVGDLLFGATGAIVGAVTRKSKNVCSSLEVNIVLRNYYKPNYTVALIEPPGLDKSSALYRDRLGLARELTAKLELITSSKEPAPEAAPPVKAADPVAEIRRYKELFDEGILTEEEFIAKKRQILGI